MKLKNFVFSFLIFFLCFISFVVKCDAVVYTTYSKGDIVEVKVNDDDKYNFYVLEDSTSDKVTAIYDGVMGDEAFWFGPKEGSIVGSVAEEKLEEYTNSWNNPEEIRLVKTAEIDPSFVLGTNANKEFSTPDYFNIGKSYWTQDVFVDRDQYYPAVVTSWGSFSTLHTTTLDAPSSGGFIRPVITISKDYVVGGTRFSEEESAWNDFVEAFKNTDVVKRYNEFDGFTVDISSTSDSLKVIFSDGNDTIQTDFAYSNGIITYVPFDSQEQNILGGLWIYNCVLALSNIKGYDIEKVVDFLDSGIEFSLDKDGIEFEVVECNDTEISSGVEINYSINGYSSFKLNIIDGLKTFTVKEEIKNPDTNVAKFLSVTTGLVLFVGITMFVRKKEY